MSITKITKNAFPASIDLSSVDLTIGNDEIVTANIADTNVTHAKLHTDMDLSSKTVTLPTISSLTVSGGNTHLDGRNSAGLTLDLAGTGHYTIREHTTDDIVKLGGTGSVNFIAHNISSGNVGIGTASPDKKLTIGYPGADSGIHIQNSSGNRMVALGAYSANEGVIRLFNSSNTETVRIAAESTAGVHTYFTGGSVGIGTNSPSQKLEVAGIVKANTGYMFGGTTSYLYESSSDIVTLRVGSNGPYMRLGSDDGEIGNSSGTTRLIAGTGGAKLLLDTNGKVGIGVDNYSVFNGVGGNSMLVVKGSNTATNIANNSNASITIANDDGTANNTAGLHFARADTDDNPHYAGASIVTQFTQAQVTGQYPKADLAFLTSTDANFAPSEKMRISASGNVGIGSGIILQNNGVVRWGNGGASIGALSYGGTGLVSLEGISSNTNIYLAPSGTGNVGIGITNPSEELHIYDAGNDPYVLVDGSGANRDSGYKINAGNGVKIMARADAGGGMYFADNAIGIIPTSGNDQYRTALFDSEIQVGGLYGSGNMSRVVLARIYEARDLDWPSGNNVNTSETDTITGVSYSRPSSAGNSTGFFGPYGQLPAGSYTALFRMKIADNSSTSYMGFIDVTGTGITDPSGQNPRPRTQTITPSLFTASNRYQYIALDFENTSNTGYVETRYIDFVTGVGTFYLDHVLIVPRLNHN